MTATAKPAHDHLIGLFEAAGYRRADAALLHPADVFVEFSGEDIRRRLFLTQDAAGAELCLRPEFTIPVSRGYLASREAGEILNFCYAGTVFRHRGGESGEFIQAGVESFARTDSEAADAEIADLALQSARQLGAASATLRMGDLALLDAVLLALKIAPGMVRRVKRALAAGRAVDTVLNAAPDGAANGAGEHSGILAAIDGMDTNAARALVKDMLALTGAQAAGGRSAAEIAERFVDQARDGKAIITTETQQVLHRFLALSGDPDAVSAEARKLARDARLDIAQALDSFDARTGFMAARGIDASKLKAVTSFARSLDYYTGFVFEIAGDNAAKPLIGGGRYDTLLRRLGAKADIPAVGFSVWVERFGARA